MRSDRAFDAFVRDAEKKTFGGGPQEEILQWLQKFKRHGNASKVSVEEVLCALPLFVSRQALEFFQDQEEANLDADVVWDWPQWKAWFVEKFNPPSKVMRKMQEYRRCLQGRQSVDEYLLEHLRLRSFCVTKGDDVEQKVQFLSGLNPKMGMAFMISSTS